MRSITVDKKTLLEKLEANRAKHADKHARAMERYQEKVTEWFQTNLNRITAGEFREIQRSCPWPVPQDHTDDYQRVIDMLAWDLGNTYELTEQDYECYVNDGWGWAREFAATNSAYMVE